MVVVIATRGDSIRAVVAFAWFSVFGVIGDESTTPGANGPTPTNPAPQARAADELPTLEGTRPIPLCITVDRYQEYSTPKMNKSNLNTMFNQVQTVKNLGFTRTVDPSSGVDKAAGDLEQIKYYRIKTGYVGKGKDPQQYPYLFQWLHIKLTTHRNVSVVIMQAVNFPFAMAWGNFDLNLADSKGRCGNDVNINKVDTGLALDYDGFAAVIPCTRRSYLHKEHPSVYVYNGPPRREFHFNYFFEDITGRELKLLQFIMILIRTTAPQYYKTAVIEHYNFYDILSGMPYPWHPELKNSVDMHGVVAPIVKTVNGEQGDLVYNKDYDDCVMATPAQFSQTYIEKTNKISDYICNKPSRHRMDFNDPYYVQNPSGSVSTGAATLCATCGPADNEFTRESIKRLIGRTYSARRFHGYAMIFGCIASQLVSIFLARYFKEAGRCKIMVGHWMWAHHVLTLLATGAVWLAAVWVIYFPIKNENTVPALIQPRKTLIIIHIVAGTIAFVLFNVSWFTGPFRPKDETARGLLILLHLLSGYGCVILAVASVVFSTACFDVKIYTAAMAVVGVIAYALAFVVQLIMDSQRPLLPPRSYFPVIEAIAVARKMPLKPIRLGLLGLLCFLILFLMILTVAFGSYEGLIIDDPCDNCKWKWDENIKLKAGMMNQAGVDDGTKKMDNKTAVDPLFKLYGCDLDNVEYDIIL